MVAGVRSVACIGRVSILTAKAEGDTNASVFPCAEFGFRMEWISGEDGVGEVGRY